MGLAWGAQSEGGVVVRGRGSPQEIRRLAAEFDDAIERRDVESALSYLADDCTIELLGIALQGKEGARRWLRWLYAHLGEVKFEPLTIMVEGTTFFEEFVVVARLADGSEVRSRQAEVLEYRGEKIISLRLYFDRLDFAAAVAGGPLGRAVVGRLVRESLKGLV